MFFFGLNEGLSEKVCQVAQKHTAAVQTSYVVKGTYS